MISAGGKIDKNLTIVGFKKSYYLNILLKNPQKNPKYSKKNSKILNFWPNIKHFQPHLTILPIEREHIIEV